MHLYCTSTNERAPGVPGLPEAARYLAGGRQRAAVSDCLTNGLFLGRTLCPQPAVFGMPQGACRNQFDELKGHHFHGVVAGVSARKVLSRSTKAHQYSTSWFFRARSANSSRRVGLALTICLLADPVSGPARDLVRSVELLEKLRQINPEGTATRFSCGVIAFHQGDWDKVIEQLPALVVDEQFEMDCRVFASVYVAMAHAQKGDVQKANEDLRTAREIIEKVKPYEGRDQLTALVSEVELLLQAQSESPLLDKK